MKFMVNKYAPMANFVIPEAPPSEERPLQHQPERNRPIDQGLLRILEEVYSFKLWPALSKLAKPNPTKSSLRIVLRIVIVASIAYAFGYYFRSIWLWISLPTLSFVLSAQLMALGKHLHDASHGNLHQLKAPKDLIKKLAHLFSIPKKAFFNVVFLRSFLAPLLLINTRHYRKSHNSHHIFFGDFKQDEEKLKIKTTLPSATRKKLFTIFHLARPILYNLHIWLDNTLGSLLSIPLYRNIKLVIWWIVLALIYAHYFGNWPALAFAVFMLLSRATFLHIFKVTSELCDHGGLSNKTILSYTRTMPKNGWSCILFPDNDNYHLAHHLFPKIPLPNLEQAHGILMNCPSYRNAKHFDSYLKGKSPLMDDLLNSISESSLNHT